MIKATRVNDIDDLRNNRIAGAYDLVMRADGSYAGMSFICPCGCGRESFMHFKPEPSPSWTFDGSEDAPTLRPSVFNSGMPCKWHGWLTNGYWHTDLNSVPLPAR